MIDGGISADHHTGADRELAAGLARSGPRPHAAGRRLLIAGRLTCSVHRVGKANADDRAAQ